jgi:hypothetical protein
VLTKIALTTIFADAKNPRIKDRIVSVQRRGALLGGGITRIFYQSLPILLRRLASYGECGAEVRLTATASRWPFGRVICCAEPALRALGMN